jgi:ubiquinone/menaquinone biosynthesis C-methylase UbiE
MSYLIDNKISFYKNSPYRNKVNRIKKIFAQIEKNSSFDLLRCNIVFKFFFLYDLIIKKPTLSFKEFNNFLLDSEKEIRTYIKLQKFLKKKDSKFIEIVSQKEKINNSDYKKITGDHYSKLFDGFNMKHLITQPRVLLKKRFIKNNVNLKDFRNKTALDLGCGNGRYTFALKSFGFKKVVGIDISPKNIEMAKYNAKKLSIKNVFFKVGDVLKLNYKKNNFDFVMSYGVFHRTKSIERGLSEMVRVTKKGGAGLVFLIGHGGVKWTIIELCRYILQYTDRQFITDYMKLTKISQKYIYLILDHLLVPINHLTSEQEIDKIFSKLKIKKFFKWKRGSKYDEIERIFINKKQISKNNLFHMFGVGENKYYYTK